MKIGLFFVFTCILMIAGCTHLPTTSDVTNAPIQEINVKVDWLTTIAASQQHYFLSPPVIDEQRIYIADYRGNLLAFNRHTKKQSWKTHLPERIVTGIAIHDTQLWVITAKEMLYAINTEDGRINWRVTLPAEAINTPACDNHVVVVKTTDGQLLAYNPENGELQWRYRESLPEFILRQDNPPKIAYPYVFAGFANGNIVALAADSGRLIWEQTVAQPLGFSEVKRMVDVTGELQLAEDMLYISSYSGNITAVDSRSGQIRWSRMLAPKPGIAVNERQVTITDSQGFIWALDRESGKVIWRQNDLQHHHLTAPAMLGAYSVVADNQGHIYCLANEDGHFVAQLYFSKMDIQLPPIMYEDKMYILTTKGQLLVLKVNH